MTWIIFALIAPFFWAVSNLFDKYALEKLSKSIPDFIFFGSIGNIILTVVVFSFVDLDPISGFLMSMAIAGGALLNYGYILYAKALEKEDASHVVPLYQFIPVFVMILGVIFFEEFVSRVQFIGFLIIFIGAVILTIEKNTFNKFRVKSVLWIMMLSSLMISVSILFTDTVLESVPFKTLFAYDVLGFSLAGFSLFLYAPWRRVIVKGLKEAKPKKYLLFFINDGFDQVGHVSLMFALIAAPSAALVTVLIGIQPFYVLMMVLILTYAYPHIIKENISRTILYQKLGGIAVIFIGVIIISLL